MARLLAVCHSRLVMVDLSLPLYQRMGCTTKDRAARLSHAAQALPLSESALRSLSSVAVPSAQTQWSLPDLSYFRQFVVLTSGSTSIRTLRFQCSRASSNRRKRLEAELTYFRNQQSRMHYPDYLRLKLPIASGVMEASCKTLVTQRLKRSGMAWTKPGGQAILTLRSLIQSNRWRPAWALLSADFRKTVTVFNLPNQQTVIPSLLSQTQPITLSGSTPQIEPFEDGSFAEKVNDYIVRKESAQSVRSFGYAALSLAA